MDSIVNDSIRIPVKETDYLDEDKPIRGQNYALMSFISPEEILNDKEVFFYGKFIASLGKNLKELLDGLRSKYPDDVQLLNQIEENHNYFMDPKELQDQYRFFKSVHLAEMDKEFHANNGYKTTVRGVKIRGVFDTTEEAKTRAEVLKRGGDKFDIFLGQVGCWCPFSPNPEDLQDQEYAETELNTLMKKYKNNMDIRDLDFEERKQKKIDAGIKEAEEKKAKLQELEKTTSTLSVEDAPADAPAVDAPADAPAVDAPAVDAPADAPAVDAPADAPAVDAPAQV